MRIIYGFFISCNMQLLYMMFSTSLQRNCSIVRLHFCLRLIDLELWRRAFYWTLFVLWQANCDCGSNSIRSRNDVRSFNQGRPSFQPLICTRHLRSAFIVSSSCVACQYILWCRYAAKGIVWAAGHWRHSAVSKATESAAELMALKSRYLVAELLCSTHP